MKQFAKQSTAMGSRASGSQVLKYQEGYTWQERVRRVYKDEGGNWTGVTRTSLVGGSDELPVPFHLRYFEVEAGGFSSLEKHEHQHVVVIMRGRGKVTLGDRETTVAFGDVVYIAPWEVHQFGNPGGPEPLGFLCVVPAERDRPVAIERKSTER
jgi:S-methyl-1-thioxylulose 5-phosphate methylthiotransferase